MVDEDPDVPLRNWLRGKLTTAESLATEGEHGKRAAILMLDAADAVVDELHKRTGIRPTLGLVGARLDALRRSLGR